MLQVENEYGSFGNDINYMARLKQIWTQNGIDVPFFTGDGPTTYMLEAGSLPGCAVGLDSGSSLKDFELANKINPGVPVFSSETYPGWLTHWGEKWARPDTSNLLKEVKFLMDNKKSLVFLNGEYIGKLDRREGVNSITIPESKVTNPVLEIFVEAMGRINFAQYLIDRKGITDRVTLNGMTLMNWEIYDLPMEESFIAGLKPSGKPESKNGIFFKGLFNLDKTGDTFMDFTNYQKGIIWVNGHNLGRYWNIGPQKRLYCPASWLKNGENEIVVFDLLQTEAKSVNGYKVME